MTLMSTSILAATESLSASKSKHGVAAPGLGQIVRQYAMETPHVEWLTRLQLDEPRESIQCLPQSVRVGKLAFDIAATTTMLLLLSPLLVLNWIAIRVTSPGAAICSQTRVSLN